MVDKINQLAEKCAKRNIQLIMFIPGPAEPEAKELEVYQGAFKIPLINVVNPEVNPEFHVYENRWDVGHLNEKGSQILSKKLVRKLEGVLETR